MYYIFLQELIFPVIMIGGLLFFIGIIVDQELGPGSNNHIKEINVNGTEWVYKEIYIAPKSKEESIMLWDCIYCMISIKVMKVSMLI